MGATVRRHMRTRPVFFCSMRPACSRTWRCLRIAGMEMSCGLASSVTEACPRCKVVRMVRRVGSLRAEKVASRLIRYLTIRLCIIPGSGGLSRGDADFLSGLRSEEMPWNHGFAKKRFPLNKYHPPPIENPAATRTLQTEHAHEVTHPSIQRPHSCYHSRGFSCLRTNPNP